MSYGIQFYAVDAAKLMQALGEGGPDLMASMRENLREQFEEDEEDRDEEDLPLERTIELLLAGEFGVEGADYLYGLEALCLHLGEAIDDLPDFESAHFLFFDRIGPLHVGFQTPLPFAIPTEDSRYKPLYFTRETLRQTVADEPDEIDDDDDDDREIGAARLDLLDVFESVADDELDLIGFYG